MTEPGEQMLAGDPLPWLVALGSIRGSTSKAFCSLTDEHAITRSLVPPISSYRSSARQCCAAHFVESTAVSQLPAPAIGAFADQDLFEGRFDLFLRNW